MDDHAKESASNRVPSRVLLKIIVVSRVIKRLGVGFGFGLRRENQERVLPACTLLVSVTIIERDPPTTIVLGSVCLLLGGPREQLGASGSGKTSITKVRGS